MLARSMMSNMSLSICEGFSHFIFSKLITILKDIWRHPAGLNNAHDSHTVANGDFTPGVPPRLHSLTVYTVKFSASRMNSAF